MKTALLHYWLLRMRGGEKVLASLARMLPEADIFAHAYSEDGTGGAFAGRRVRETFIASLPFGRRKPQAWLPLMPAAMRRLDLSGYDLIVSSESGPAKGVIKPKNARHVCYCHTPMRYLWDMHDEYMREAGPAGKLAMALFTKYLRKEDLKSAESVDEFVANSAFVAERIKRIYGRESTVIHPPVDTEWFGAAPERKDNTDRLSPNNERSYYLFAGANVGYKRLDLAKAACERMGRRLVVASNVDAAALRSLYSGAKALLFPGIEDFGIVPVEAQAAGTPVIAYGSGGALETVKDGRTGLFFSKQSVDALCEAIEEFESRTWSAAECRANAALFDKSVFERKMRALLLI